MDDDDKKKRKIAEANDLIYTSMEISSRKKWHFPVLPFQVLFHHVLPILTIWV